MAVNGDEGLDQALMGDGRVSFRRAVARSVSVGLSRQVSMSNLSPRLAKLSLYLTSDVLKAYLGAAVLAFALVGNPIKFTDSYSERKQALEAIFRTVIANVLSTLSIGVLLSMFLNEEDTIDAAIISHIVEMVSYILGALPCVVCFIYIPSKLVLFIALSTLLIVRLTLASEAWILFHPIERYGVYGSMDMLL